MASLPTRKSQFPHSWNFTFASSTDNWKGSANDSQSRPFILNIPDEVLVFILRLVQIESTGETTPIELIASLVCQKWHRTIVDTPLLWCNILFCATPRETFRRSPLTQRTESINGHTRSNWWKSPDILQVYIARFGAHGALNILLDFEGWGEYFQIIAPHAARFRRLTLISKPSQKTPQELDLEGLISDVAAPFLEYLHMDFRVNHRQPTETHISLTSTPEPRIFSQGAPSLSTANLCCQTAQRWFPPLQTVTTLSLFSPNGGVSLPFILNVMKHMPQLTNLSLNITSTDWSRPGSQKVAPASIRWLRIADIDQFFWLQKHVIFPNLEVVELYRISTGFLPVQETQCFSSVRTLVVRDCTEKGSIRDRVTQIFPHIQVLVIDEKRRSVSSLSEGYQDDGDEFFLEMLPTVKEHTLGQSVQRVLDFSLGGRGNDEAQTRSLTSFSGTMFGSFIPQAPQPPPWPQLQTLVMMNVHCLDHPLKDKLIQGMAIRKSAAMPIQDVIVPKGTEYLYPYHFEEFSRLATVEEQSESKLREDWTRLWSL